MTTKLVVGSVEVINSSEIKGEGKPRRYHTEANLLHSPEPKVIHVLADVLQFAIDNYPDKNAVGWRDIIQIVKEEKEIEKDGEMIKKTWDYFELSDYKYHTYKELGEIVKQIGSALVKTDHKSGKTIFNIYANTSWKWQAMAQGCAYSGVTFATAYDSLGEDGLEHSINEPEVYGLFTNAALLSTISKVISRTPSLKVVIYDGPTSDIKVGALEKIQSANTGVKVYSFDEFLKLGKENLIEPKQSKPEDIACIMYTSGSTGTPKGVLLSNANIVASIAGVNVLLRKEVTGSASYLAFLPLAHILEFVAELFMIYTGTPIGYGNVKTLTDASVRNCVGDMRAFKPSFLVGVPAVWELIRKGIVTKAANLGPVKSTLFNLAYSIKYYLGPTSNTYLGNFVDKVVFAPVKAATGGRLKIGVCAGAPISKDTQEFLSTTMCLIISGYGLTESTAFSAAVTPEYWSPGVVGLPMPSCEIKLLDFEEAGYFSTNTPPQGEILLRGPSITKGYFKRDDLTKEAFTEDGWLMSGDIGEWRPDGTLAIIDRKKNLVKLAGGEYIALERLESIYKSSSLVSHLALHADSSANKPMAIVVPHEKNLEQLAANNNIEGNLDQLCKDKRIRGLVLAELNGVGKKSGLKPLESLQTLILSSEEWTPQNGYLTAAQKLQRKTINAAFKDEIKKVYP